MPEKQNDGNREIILSAEFPNEVLWHSFRIGGVSCTRDIFNGNAGLGGRRGRMRPSRPHLQLVLF